MHDAAPPLQIAINAQLSRPGHHGGVEQFTEGLVRALGALPGDSERYTVLVAWDQPDRFQSIMGGSMSRVPAPRPPGAWRERLKSCLGPFRQAAGRMRRVCCPAASGDRQSGVDAPPEWGTFFASLGTDVVHFPYQDFLRSGKPCIYMPHDLQHLHFPQFFSPGQITTRERMYRTACLEADAVVVESSWVREDLVGRYAIDRSKAYTIPWGSPSAFWPTVTASTTAHVRKRFSLPGLFALYPAQTWPHKNHKRLIDAVAINRERYGVDVPVICTGRKNAEWPDLRRYLRASGVEDLVRFVGYVSESELAALYQAATMLVFPSLLEGGGFPVLEALSVGLPVACSAIPALREYGGDACCYFDPGDASAIGRWIRELAAQPNLREQHIRNGNMRAEMFSWNTMAKTYRALYRELGGRELNEEDVALLQQAASETPPVPCRISQSDPTDQALPGGTP